MKKQIIILFCLSLFSTLFSAEYWFSEKPSKSMKADRPLKIWTFASGTENWFVLPGRRGKIEWDKTGHLKLSSTVKHGKAIVMFGGKHQILHAPFFRVSYIEIGVKLLRMKALRQCSVFRKRDPHIAHDPLAAVWRGLPIPFSAGDRVNPPMDKKTVLCFLKPFQSIHMLPLSLLDLSLFHNI